MEHNLHWSPQPQHQQLHNEFYDFSKINTNATPSLVPVSPKVQRSSSDQETLNSFNELKQGFSKMMQAMERLETRMNRIEQVTSTILKNQQEVLQAPFMSQSELDQARKHAEQIEKDTSVAKQLQAAYNKEAEVKRTVSVSYQSVGQCPICGVRVNGIELEAHVDKCLQLFSDDPRKENEIKETKKKVEQGFFSRLYKSTTETKETKKTKVQMVPSNPQQSQSIPLLSDEGMSSAYYPPALVYPSYGHPSSPQSQHHPHAQMMMPAMYMYPSYPHLGASGNEQ